MYPHSSLYVCALWDSFYTSCAAVCSSLGFSGCIGKPFERKALKRAMQLALDPSRPWFTLIGDEQ